MGTIHHEVGHLLRSLATVLSAPPAHHLPGDGSLGIVGGDFFLPFQYPFLVSMQFGGDGKFSHGCGGSIYNERFIVDAAHCVNGVDPASIRIVAGEYLLILDSGLEQKRAVKKITMHPEYNAKTQENDIAIIELESPLDFSSGIVGKIAMSREGPAAGTDVTVAGWGTLSSGGRSPILPRKVGVSVISNQDCSNLYGDGLITDKMMCAGVPQGGKDSCQGDSGGPLFTSNPFTLVGVVSWGYGCAQAQYPGVYARVADYIDFIESVAGPQ